MPCFKKNLTTLTTEIIHCTFTSQCIAFYEHGQLVSAKRKHKTAARGRLRMISKSNNSLKATMLAGPGPKIIMETDDEVFMTMQLTIAMRYVHLIQTAFLTHKKSPLTEHKK